MISSPTNDRVKKWMKLYLKKYRDNNYLILSSALVDEAYAHGFLDTLIYVGEKPFEFTNAFEVSEDVMAKLTKDKIEKYIGIGLKKSWNLEKDVKRIMILDELQDPLNIGKILNSAYAFGFDAIIASENTADAYHEKSVLLSKGAIFKVPLFYTDIRAALSELQSHNFKVYATGLRANNYELKEVPKSENMAFVLGNEGSGVENDIMDASDGVVKIDMCNIDSLNVAMAGAIVMYNFQK